eukprot:m.233263 g.233263  ORF g.233263 m.233263 type:complete len:357 (-) comp33638_c0_seq1:123-1193(-)
MSQMWLISMVAVSTMLFVEHVSGENCEFNTNQSGYICPNSELRSMPLPFNVGTILIELERNLLTSIPVTAFYGLTNLTKLGLAYNLITSIPGTAFRDLKNLQHLGISDNKITEIISMTFASLTQLKRVGFANNEVRSLSTNGSTFFGLESVNDFDLSNNQITSVPALSFKYLTSIMSMSLSNNSITTFAYAALLGLNDLEDISLIQNPLNCSYSNGTRFPMLTCASCASAYGYMQTIEVNQEALYVCTNCNGHGVGKYDSGDCLCYVGFAGSHCESNAPLIGFVLGGLVIIGVIAGVVGFMVTHRKGRDAPTTTRINDDNDDNNTNGNDNSNDVGDSATTLLPKSAQPTSYNAISE